MVLAIEADDHGGEMVVGEDKAALAVMAVDEHAQGLERDGAAWSSLGLGRRANREEPDARKNKGAFIRPFARAVLQPDGARFFTYAASICVMGGRPPMTAIAGGSSMVVTITSGSNIHQ
jgi:hypothetical protein